MALRYGHTVSKRTLGRLARRSGVWARADSSMGEHPPRTGRIGVRIPVGPLCYERTNETYKREGGTESGVPWWSYLSPS